MKRSAGMVNEGLAGVALGAAVPKAAVHKDRDLLLGESKVGLSGQTKMPSPAGDLVLPQQRQQL